MKKKEIIVILLMLIVVLYLGINLYNEGFLNQNPTIHSSKEQSDGTENKIANLGLEGKYALLIDENDGEVLYEKNADERLYPASTTKILTALLALKYTKLDELVTVGDEVNMKIKGESTAYLIMGQTYTMKELLAGLLLPSGNDAARTIAIYIGRKIEGNEKMNSHKAMKVFVNVMNDYARKIGANNSHFENPNGLHDKNHYSTAYDMAIITKAAMKEKYFMDIVSQSFYQDEQVTYKNTNQLLDPTNEYFFKGVDGIKTGFTDEAGRCLVSSIKVKGNHLIALVFDSTDEAIFADSVKLLSAGIQYKR